MFSFANPQYLYLLLLLPAIAGMFWWSRRARQAKLKTFGRSEVIEQLMPDVSRYKPYIQLTLELLIVALVIVILARPRAGASSTSTTVHGIEMMVAVDVSNSMNASATDDPQDISRLQRAKMILEKIIDRSQNDKVGLVVFAGNAYMQMPLTSDVSSAKLFLNSINTNMVPTQGTAIGAAIEMAAGSFSQSKKSQKTIIVITDGENFEDDAVAAARQAEKNGIKVSVMGVGSTHGAPIPMPDGGYLMDDSGSQPVVTYLNEEMAQQIADAGDGLYVNGNAGDAVETLRDMLDKLAKTDLATVAYTQHDEQFPVFAWITLILIVALMFVMERKNPWLKQFNFFTRNNETD